jgi:thioesterase domain-containing protein
MRSSSSAYLSCRAVERAVCAVWSDLFGRAVSPHDDFFDLGGDSLLILDMVDAVRGTAIPLRSSQALRHSTPARLAESLTLRRDQPTPDDTTALASLRVAPDDAARIRARSWATVSSRMVRIIPSGEADPLWILHSDSHVGAEQESVRTWCDGRPILGLSPLGMDGSLPPSGALAEMAGHYVDMLVREQPAGSYHLVGFGNGAVVALETARQLRGTGREVPLLAMVRPTTAGRPAGSPSSTDEILAHRLVALARRFAFVGTESVDEILDRMRQDGWYGGDLAATDLPVSQLAWAELTRAIREYDCPGYDGTVLVFQDEADTPVADERWGAAIAQPQTHLFGYGIEAPCPIIADPRLTAIMRKELAR